MIMELSEATLSLLRDEAYASIARQQLHEQIEGLEQKRASVATTRPPFGGVLARRETRDTFTRSMRDVDEHEGALRDQLSQLAGIENWLRPVIRRDVSSYLSSASPDYCRLLQIAARLDDWERAYHSVPESFVAFARDLRDLRQALAPAKKTAPAHELAVLREIAERLAQQRHELGVIEQAALALMPEGLAEPIPFPPLPDMQRLPWVGRLAVIPPERALAEVTRVEAEARAFLEGPSDRVFAVLQTSRDACARIVDQQLEAYWAQLRAHACAHYVDEREVADVIQMLNERYIDPEIQRRQQAMSSDPFMGR